MSAFERTSNLDRVSRNFFAPSPVARALLRPPSRPDRVVTLASVSATIPGRFIAETFSHSLRSETGGSVLLVHLEPVAAPNSLQDWATLQPQVNGEFALSSLLEHTEAGVAILRLKVLAVPATPTQISKLALDTSTPT